MRKLKKFAALLAVAAMCAGLGMTAFATDSPIDSPTEGGRPQPPVITPTEPSTGVGLGHVTDKDGKKVTVIDKAVAKEVEDILKNDEKVKDIFKEAGLAVGKDQDVKVIGMADYSYEGEIPKEGVDFTIQVDDDDLKAGDTVYVLHKTKNGWEVWAGTIKLVDGQKTVTVHVTSFSPFAVVKVMSNGKVVQVDKITGKPVDNTRKSPKTGR